MPDSFLIEPPGLEALRFQSASQLQTWVNRQIAGWVKLRDLASEKTAGGAAVSICANALKSLEALRDMIANNLRGEKIANRPGVEMEIRNGLGNLWLPYDSRDMGLVQRALETYGGPCAGRLLEYFFRAKGKQTTAFWNAADGNLMALLDSEMILKRADYEPLDQLRKDWDVEREGEKTTWDKWFEETTEEAGRLKEQYKQIQALSEPANYWGTKRRWHLGAAAVFLALVVLLAVFGGEALISRMDRSRSEMQEALGKPQPTVASPSLQAILLIPHALPTLVVAIGLLWALRLLARLFLVQVHLHADAAERVVMVKTYLSLLTGKGVLEGKPALNPDDLTIILSQLFRHESTGVFPDDSGPQLPIAELVKIGKPEKDAK